MFKIGDKVVVVSTTHSEAFRSEEENYYDIGAVGTIVELDYDEVEEGSVGVEFISGKFHDFGDEFPSVYVGICDLQLVEEK